MVLRVFSVLCVYSTFGHHPHPLGYLRTKFCFCHGLHCWASPRRKITYSVNNYFVFFMTSIDQLAHGEKSCTESINQSLTELTWCNGNRSFRFGINVHLNTSDETDVDTATDDSRQSNTEVYYSWDKSSQSYQFQCCVEFSQPWVGKTLNARDCSLEVTETNTVIVCEAWISFNTVLQPLCQLQPT